MTARTRLDRLKVALDKARTDYELELGLFQDGCDHFLVMEDSRRSPSQRVCIDCGLWESAWWFGERSKTVMDNHEPGPIKGGHRVRLHSEFLIKCPPGRDTVSYRRCR